MTWGIIGTWRMALEGIIEAKNILEGGKSSIDAVEVAVKIVEDFPDYRSVGYGGLPNEEGEVELDAAFMDGDTLSIGAVAGIKDFQNPVSIARKLMEEKYNNFLVGSGAEKYAHRMGFDRKNMLTDFAREEWKKKIEETKIGKLKSYDGHDTVCIVGLDRNKKISVGTSTSGLFMKKQGRVGDSPVSGSGFYADSEIGAASATGLGEDIMKGCISYDIVSLMERGVNPQEAAEKAVYNLNKKLINRRGVAGDISAICMNDKGEWGVGTNIKKFSFVVATEFLKPTVYIASFLNGKTKYVKASQEWIDTNTE